jgi:hypothetical protein
MDYRRAIEVVPTVIARLVERVGTSIMAIGTLRGWKIDANDDFFGSPLKGFSDKIRHHAAATHVEFAALFAHVRKSVTVSSARLQLARRLEATARGKLRSKRTA